MCAGLELGSHFRIHRNHHFLLGIHQGVPMLNLLVDPLLESLSRDGRANFPQPLLWDLWKINVIWKVGMDSGLVTDIH